MQIAIESQIDHLVLLNSQILNFKNIGIRNKPVFCKDKQGTEYEFLPPEVVPEALSLVLEDFSGRWEMANSLDTIARLCAQFWLNFISIHPFENGNGRTAESYLVDRLYEKDLELRDVRVFKGYVMGHQSADEDFKNLYKLFLVSICPIEKGVSK